MSKSNVEIVRRGFEAAVRGDLDAIRDILDPDVKWHGGNPDDAGSCHNRREALDFMRQAFASGPPGELVDVVEAGEKVVVILAPPGNGRPVANLTTFRNGKVTEMVHFPDVDDALAAAGLSRRQSPSDS